MSFRVLIEWRKHYRKNDLDVVAHKIAKVLVIPEIQGSFSNLEMRTCDRLGKLVEEGFLDLGELGGVHDLEYVLHFVQEHHLFGTIGLRPIAKQSKHNLIR